MGKQFEDEIVVKKLTVQQTFTSAVQTVTADTINESTSAAGVTVEGVLLKDGTIDLNGVADALILDAAGAVILDGSSAGKARVKISGAYDFEIAANTLTALSGSTIATNAIAETTAASGVTIDGVLLKDGGAVFADAAVVEVDTINEATAAAGVTVDGLLIKDGIVGALQAITGDGAITIQNATVLLSKAGAGAITIATPTATTHDGRIIRVVSLTAQAHVITSATDGFNDKGSSGTATFGGAIGDSVTLLAYQANWYVIATRNVTIA